MKLHGNQQKHDLKLSYRAFHSIPRIFWVSQQVAFSLHMSFQYFNTQASLGLCSVVAAAGCAEAPQPIAERSRWGGRMSVDHGWGEQMREPVSCKVSTKIHIVPKYFFRLTRQSCPSAPASNSSKGREAIDFGFRIPFSNGPSSGVLSSGKPYSKLLNRTHAEP